MRRVGMLGGGQLGRMTLEAGAAYLAEVAVLDPDPEAPCARLASSFTRASLMDPEAILALGRSVDVLTCEIEAVNVSALRILEAEGRKVIPSSPVLGLIQDKAAQKALWDKHGIPTSPWTLVAGDRPDQAALDAAAGALGGYPVVQKARRGGYDGRGVRILPSGSSEALACPSLAEAKVDFLKELGVVVARAEDGSMAAWPCVEMVFDPRVNLCDSVLAPAQVDLQVLAKAREVALACVAALDQEARSEAAQGGFATTGASGIFGVELFLTRSGEVLVNEVAPRPHNSGHFSIEASVTSQFDQFLRILLGLPLGSTDLLAPAMMVNLLGEAGATGRPDYQGLDLALAQPGVALHLYGKPEVRPFRKMGHLTALGSTPEEAQARAEAARAGLRILGIQGYTPGP